MGELKELPDGVLLESLTWREQDILRLLAEHHTNQEIARALGIELTTVKWYNRQLFSKLGVGSRRAAALKAREYGLMGEPQPASDAEATPARGNLPAQVTSFVGREREMVEVGQLLEAARLLTLTGPPGTGKTRLALQVAGKAASAGAFDDGVFFANLAPISAPDLVADTIAAALGVPQATGRPLAERLAHYLSPKQLLLVVDNFEHVIEAAPLLAELLAAAPGLRVLATSRERLQLYGEQEYPVPPLMLPDLEHPQPPAALLQVEAVALFVRRAQAVRPGFALAADDAPAVAEICVRLDGLPLAIELAAARMRLFSPHALLGQLDSRLAALQGGARGLPERQRTLQAAIAWSCDLLSDAEKALFARLSVFQGGRSIEAAQAVCGPDLPLDALDGLESLVNKSLLRAVEGPHGEPRFVMLETIHEYARDMLARMDETDALRRRHAEFFTALAERAEPHTRGGPDRLYWLRRLEADHDNLRAALDWSLGGGDVEPGLRLVGALGHFWRDQARFTDGQRWTARALGTSSDASPPVRAALLFTAGLTAFHAHDPVNGKRLHEEALALYRELGDRRGVGWALAFLGVQSVGQADEYEAAVTLVQEGMAIFREAGDQGGVAQALNSLGELARVHGDLARAKQAYEECVAIAREMGDIFREWHQYYNLGHIALQEGDAAGAVAWFGQFLLTSIQSGIRHEAAYGLYGLAGAAAALGQPEQAARLVGAAEAQYRTYRYTPWPIELDASNRILAAVHAALSPEAFAAAYAEGQAMSLEQAVACALADDNLSRPPTANR